MKKIIAILICLCLCVSFAGCANKSTPSENTDIVDAHETSESVTKKEDEHYKQVCVDITTKGNGCYSTFSDVKIAYYKDKVSYILIENPTLLAFQVSDRYDGGVCLIDGVELEQMIQSLIDAKDTLNETDAASAYIDIVLEILQSKGIYDYCPT